MNVKDRVESAKHTLTGSGLGKAISKATSHEVIGPKRKHVDYILTALETDNVSIPDTADMLFERCNNSSWVVVFKGLVTFHHIMSNGNERFIQYIASKSATWMLQNFLDKNGVQGYDMSHIIRKYAAYLTEKGVSYRTMGFDFCKIPRGKDGGVLRNMDTVKLLKALPAIQVQLDALVATEISSNDLTNGVVTAAFMLLFRDLIRLFACYNDGIINLLEKYFEMKKNDCKASLEIYKRFLARMDKVSDFLKYAEDAGIDKGDIPDLSKAPNSLLEALDTHYQSLEKGKNAVPPPRPVTLPAFNVEQWYMKSEKWMENGSDTTPSTPPAENKEEDYIEQQKRLLEMFQKNKEEEMLRQQQQKQQQQKQQQAFEPVKAPEILGPPQQSHRAPSPQNNSITTPAPEPVSSTKPSDDLLCLNTNISASQPFMPTSNFGNMSQFGNTSSNNFFASSSSGFDFGAPPSKPVDFSNPFLQPTHSSSTPNLLDDILTPETPTQQATTPTENPVKDTRLTGDLNKGLERVALSLVNVDFAEKDEWKDGLNINPGTFKATTQKGHQWTPNDQGQAKTGGANYRMTGVARTTLPPVGYNPAVQPRYPYAPQPFYGLPQSGMYQQMPIQSGMYGNIGYNQRLMTPTPNVMNMNDDPFK